MKGWKTRTFTEKFCLHHREMGTAQGGPIQARFKFGAKDYAIGNHPAWELFRSAYQMTRRPFVVGGLALGAGYIWASFDARTGQSRVSSWRFTGRNRCTGSTEFLTANCDRARTQACVGKRDEPR